MHSISTDWLRIQWVGAVAGAAVGLGVTGTDSAALGAVLGYFAGKTLESFRFVARAS